MPDTVLVLGAAGFIGRHVCLRLAMSGYSVHGFGHGRMAPAEWSSWGMARWTAADVTVTDLQSAAGDESPCAIIHCAGSGAVGHSYAQPLDDFNRTVATTAAALEFARICNRPEMRVVLASSAAVYGDQGDVDLCETGTRAPVSPYGFHKLAAEGLCDSYARFFGVRVSLVRLFSVYGEGLRKQLLWDALNKLARGERTFFGTGNELRDWIHVSDAAQLLCLAAQAQQGSFEIYNGAHEKASTSAVLAKLARIAGFDGQIDFNGHAHSGNPRRLTGACTHAWQQLGWRGSVGLDEGLARYVEWFQQNESRPETRP